MSRGRDEWLARRAAAARLAPPATAQRAIAVRRLWGGWQITVTGEGLTPLGGPGGVEIGGTALEDVRFSGGEVTGHLRRLPDMREASIDLGATRLEAVPLRIRPGRVLPSGWRGAWRGVRRRLR